MLFTPALRSMTRVGTAMVWVLAASDEASPDQGRDPMRLTFEHEGQPLSIRVAPLDAAQVRRILAPYVVEARAAMNDLSDTAKVRRWVRANGYEVADRGRISREIVGAYNLVNGADAVDRSGHKRAAPRRSGNRPDDGCEADALIRHRDDGGHSRQRRDRAPV